MTDLDQTTYVARDRDDVIRDRGPIFAPLDFVAFLMIVLMIWGPLAAGAFRH